MMKCDNCGKTFKNDKAFCLFCGAPLRVDTPNKFKGAAELLKKYWIIIAGVLIVCIAMSVLAVDNERRQEIKDSIRRSQIVKEINAPSIFDLQIQPGWTNSKSGNYTYINGSIMNISNKTVKYYKITAKFYDTTGSVIDSDYTNSAETLLPDESSQFEIMHKYDSRVENIRLFIDEVR